MENKLSSTTPQNCNTEQLNGCLSDVKSSQNSNTSTPNGLKTDNDLVNSEMIIDVSKNSNLHVNNLESINLDDLLKLNENGLTSEKTSTDKQNESKIPLEEISGKSLFFFK